MGAGGDSRSDDDLRVPAPTSHGETRAWESGAQSRSSEPLNLTAQEHAARLLEEAIGGEDHVLRSGLDMMQEKLLGAPGGAARIGRYTVLRKLGQGGMGVVLSAYDEELDRRVALKLLRVDRHSDSSQGRARLVREAQALARLSHPNVIQIYDVGEYNGQVFLAMEYVPGDTLRVWLKRCKWPWRDVVEMFIQAGKGLSAAHRAGLVHRDFKPDNVLVGTDGRVRVLDFGLVRADAGETRQVEKTGQLPVVGDDPGSSGASNSSGLSDALTQTGTLIGTPAYMAPEQRLKQTADARSDQFSFCVALYEGLYGVRPFAETKPMELVYKIMHGVVAEPPRAANVPAWLRKVVLRGLRGRPDERYASMDELTRALERDPTRAWRRTTAAMGLILAVGSGGYGLAQWQAGREPACQDGRVKLTGIWDEARKGAVREALLGTGTAFAEETWTWVEAGLDEHTTRWVTMYQDACEATNVRGEQSAALLDLRMECLRGRLVEVSALVGVLAEADAGVVEHAAHAVTKLESLERCADAKRLSGQIAGPEDETSAAEVSALRELLAQAEAEQRAGRYAKGLEIARRGVERARTLAYRPLLAEGLTRQGHLQSELADYMGAEESLISAMDEAEASRHDEVAADAAIQYLWVVGAGQKRIGEALGEVHHVRALVDRAHSRWSAGLFEQALGQVTAEQGKYAESEAHFRRALALLAAELGPDHTRLARVHDALGQTLASMGQYSAALASKERALDILRASLGPEHPQVARVLSSTGSIYSDQGRFDEACAVLERALALHERALGPEHPAVATDLSSLSTVHSLMGAHAEAQALLERALAIQEKTLGPAHPNTAQVLNNLAAEHVKTGAYTEARTLHERALAIREQALGPDHPHVAYSLNNLGAVHEAVGAHAEARALFERALAIAEKALGPDHPHVAMMLNNLANTLLALGAYEQARVLYERALAIREEVLGPDHHQVAQALDNLANAHQLMGAYEQARVLYERALAIEERARGPDHPGVATILHNLASALEATGAHAEASALYERALTINEKALGPDHPDVAYDLTGLANVRLTQNEPRDALQLVERAVAVYDRHDGVQGGELSARFALARALIATRGDRIRALASARAARDEYQKLGQGAVQELAEVETWLARHGRSR